MALPLSGEIAHLVADALALDPREVAPLLGAPPQASMGDYALPCFALAPRLGKDPKSLARELESRLAAGGAIKEARAAGPYLNIRVSTEALAREVLGGIVRAAEVGRPYAATDECAGKTVVIEYSSPNIAKPFGIGHLRSTVIGNSLARLYAAAGCRVVRLNYLGDWGTQFGYLLANWRLAGDEARLEKEGVDYLVELYKDATEKAGRTIDSPLELERLGNYAPAGTPTFAEVAACAFKALERGDEESRKNWQRFRDVSLREFQRVYDLLGVSFDSFDGEAATQPSIPAAVERLRTSGLLEESEGAQVVRLGLGENVPPAMILKSDGATTYLARDLAAVLDRWERYRFERCVYVVGRDQELHFRQLFRVLELMGLDWAARCVHVPFGMIRFGGEKMRTRKGTSVLLGDVLARAFEELGRIVETRKKGGTLDEAAQRAADRAVAIGAVIFADLSRRRIKDFDFDWETAFSLEGDSGPYLQYAHARAVGILKKAGRTPPRDADLSLLSSEAERELVMALGRYPDAVARARSANEPSILGSHLVEIGRALNQFYNACRVLGSERGLEDARLLLVSCARTVLAEALGMLGIAAPEAI